ncbi:MAG: ABC transporter ATP-binding protein [Acidobacteria bacterium]|nr:MAG: ABC transporter ATP-binding protein [Acidobacteriota bacterium]PYY21820.1 MAG: ABC transporter ATP-binding protein [Acidobacteriota bacterium]
MDHHGKSSEKRFPSREERVLFRKRLFELARPSYPHLAGILLLGMVSVPLSMLMPLPLKIAVDSVIGNQPLPRILDRLVPAGLASSTTENLIVVLVILVGLAVLSNLQTLASWLLQTYTGERLVFELRNRLFWHAQRLSLATHDRRGVNDIAYRIQHDSPAIQYIFIQGILPLVTAALTFMGMFYVVARIDRSIAVVALVISPALMIAARRSGYRVRRAWQGVKTLDSSAMLLMNEALASIRVVKAFNTEDFEDTRFRLRSRERMKEQVRLASIQAGYHLLISLAIAVGSAAALLIGIRHVKMGLVTLGDLLLVMAYVAQLYEPLRVISSKIPDLQSWRVSLERAFALFEENPELGVISGHDAKASPASGLVAFENVTFEYANGQRALDGVSFSVPAGTKVALIGPSGSGKTTLVNLLTRFYEPTSGRVLLDDVDLHTYSVTHLRQQFAVIGQEPVLFSATVADNISYGRFDASRDEIIAAAVAAHAHEFITSLPRGYETRIGDGGSRLSGGQRQRLSIARAFLKNAPILILDEPTSALDAATESELLDSLHHVMEGRTAFVIAHRLNTIRDCDLLLMLEKGKLKEMRWRTEEPISVAAEMLAR